MNTITMRNEAASGELHKKVLIPLFYVMLFLVLALAAVMVITMSSRSLRSSEAMARSVVEYKALLQISTLADEMQMASIRLLFNREPDDIDMETEYIAAVRKNYDDTWAGFYSGMEPARGGDQLDLVLFYKQINDAARDRVLAIAHERTLSRADAAIHTYYELSRPAYDAYEFAIDRMAAELKTNIDKQLAATDQFVRQTSRVVYGLLIAGFLLIVLNGVLVTRQQRRYNRMKDQLFNERSEKQAELMRVTLSVQEKERNKLGRDLHDNVNQLLSVVKLKLSLALSHSGSKEPLVCDSLSYVEQAMEEIRVLSRLLVAPMTTNISLHSCLRKLINTLKPLTPGTRFTLCLPQEELMLDDDRKLALYRIAQEHLSNVVKHAGASKVRVQLDSSGGEVILEIVDNGKGFDTTAPRTGIGLSNIANRCEVFGGVAQIVSTPGKGCTLRAAIPDQLNQAGQHRA